MPPREDETLGGLPDSWRTSSQPIVIYQGGPPPGAETPTSNALGLLFWLAMITLCLGVAGFSAWAMWNPNHDKDVFSPIYAEGRPLGLYRQIEERERVNETSAGLTEFRDAVRRQNSSSDRSAITHPLVTGEGGIDALRREWDELCNTIRFQIYEERLGQVGDLIRQRQQQRALATTTEERRLLDQELVNLRDQVTLLQRERDTQSNPALRCTPAREADACTPSDHEPWCDGTGAVFNVRER